MSTEPSVQDRPRQEHGDPQARVILVIAAGILAMLVLAAVVGYLLLRAGGPIRNSPDSAQTAGNTRLASNPDDEIASYERAKQAQLHGYGWVDPRHQVAHIPIELAMQRLAERGSHPESQP
jgi:hypothetical protein